MEKELIYVKIREKSEKTKKMFLWYPLDKISILYFLSNKINKTYINININGT